MNSSVSGRGALGASTAVVALARGRAFAVAFLPRALTTVRRPPAPLRRAGGLPGVPKRGAATTSASVDSMTEAACRARAARGMTGSAGGRRPPGPRRAAVFRVALRAAPALRLRVALRAAGAFLTVRPDAFRADAFRTVVFFAAVLRAVVFLAAAFLAAAFLAGRVLFAAAGRPTVRFLAVARPREFARFF